MLHPAALVSSDGEHLRLGMPFDRQGSYRHVTVGDQVRPGGFREERHVVGQPAENPVGVGGSLVPACPLECFPEVPYRPPDMLFGLPPLGLAPPGEGRYGNEVRDVRREGPAVRGPLRPDGAEGGQEGGEFGTDGGEAVFLCLRECPDRLQLLDEPIR